MQRGRKSKNQPPPTVVSLVPGTRPDPPAELTLEQAETWRAVVGRMPVGRATPEVWPLLCQLCRHTAVASMIGAELAETDPKSIGEEIGFRRFERLRRMHQAEGAAISRLMTKLRVTPHAQSQRHAHLAASQSRPGPKPWETTD